MHSLTQHLRFYHLFFKGRIQSVVGIYLNLSLKLQLWALEIFGTRFDDG